MASKPKRQSKAVKPDCKVWAQVGEEVLAEYLNKPIDSVNGHECWLVVALGDLLTLHCQAKPGIVDEFVLIVDGIIRGCEFRRNTIVVFDKVLHREKGRGKQPGAVYRSDMVVQMRDGEKSTMAKADEELSKVGTIVVEGWCKVEDQKSTESKVGEALKFTTFEESREWHDVNRFVNPSPGHLPPFEVGFIHGENRCSSSNGSRTRVASAATRNAAEWKLAYKYVFNLRSATEMHKLGQTDVPVRNPKANLFAEDPEKVQAEARDSEEQVVEPGLENDVEEPEKPVDETPKEKVVESQRKVNEILEEKLAEAGNVKVPEKSKEKPKTNSKTVEKPKDNAQDGASSQSVETTTKKKSKSKDPAILPQHTVSGLLELMANTAADVLVGTAMIDSAKSSPNVAPVVPQAAAEPLPEFQFQEPKEPLAESGEGLVLKDEGEAHTSEPARVTPKKMSLPGLKSAPASKASRDRSLSADSDASQVLPSTEALDQPLMPQHPEQELSKSAGASMTSLPATPPPSSSKSKSSLDLTGALERLPINRRVSLPSPSALQGPRDVSEPRVYVMSSSDYTISGVQHVQAAGLPVNEGHRSREGSARSFVHKPTSRRVSFLDDRPDFRADSQASDASTEVADPAEIRARMDSQKWSSGSSIQNLVDSEGDMSFNRYSRSDSMTPEPQNHTESSPILGSPPRSFVAHTQPEQRNEFSAMQVRKHSQEREMEPHDCPSTQFRQEIAESFGATSSRKGRNMVLQAIPSSQQAIHGSSLAASLHENHQSSLPQPKSFIAKRMADETTGNGSLAESARPRKSSIAPANRSIVETLRCQQEENDRLEQELKDLRLYNATLENIRELKKKSHGVQERINAEKARQAALEAELEQ